jgi:AAA15 family ATPase/GTPase
MRITKLTLRNFKRFSDLVMDKIPDTSKLVLLIGANGSGKSSVFDAFELIRKRTTLIDNFILVDDTEINGYYKKNDQTLQVDLTLADGRQIGLGSKPEIIAAISDKLIGRSSIRIVPRIQKTGNVEASTPNDDAPDFFIDIDERFNNDVASYIQMIDNALREPVFSGRSADTLKIFQDFISPLNLSLINIFGGDELTTIQIAEFKNATNKESAKLIFRKGNSKINYDLLSHGEKQVVILLLNFIVRKEQYEDAIIYIDEMDCHLNTSLQANLLSEIVNVWIPDNAQLWTATHALGFIDFARHSENASIIDLDSLNFDLPQILMPEPKESLEVYDIAVPKETLQRILHGYKLVVVENQNDKHLNLALNVDGYFFLPAKDSREVFLTIKGDETKLGIRDRDYFRDDEIIAIRKLYPNLRILHYYAFENYIYHPNNIAELGWPGFDKKEYLEEIIAQKNKSLHRIILGIVSARQTYIEFKDVIKNDNKAEPIVHALESDEFEIFYPYFSMKTFYNKNYLQHFRYTISDLVKTDWFKVQIANLLK